MATESSSTSRQEQALEQVETLAGETKIQKAEQTANQLEMYLFPKISLDNPEAAKEVTENQIAVRKRIDAILEDEETYPLSQEVTELLLRLYSLLSETIEKAEGKFETEKREQKQERKSSGPRINLMPPEPSRWERTKRRAGEWKEKARERREATKADLERKKRCLNIVAPFVDLTRQPEYEAVISELLFNNAKKILHHVHETGNMAVTIDQIIGRMEKNLTDYLQEEVYKQSEVLEANTDELRTILDEARVMRPEDVRFKINEIRQKINENKERLKEIKTRMAEIATDEKSLVNQQAMLSKGTKRGKEEAQAQAEQLKATKEKLDGLYNERRKLRKERQKRIKANARENKKIDIITKGARDQLRKNRKIAPETLLLYLQMHFDRQTAKQAGKPFAEPMEAIKSAMEKTEKRIQSIETKGSTRKGLMYYHLKNANREECIAFLASDKSPLKGVLPDEALAAVSELREIKPKQISELKKWITGNLAERLPEENRETYLRKGVVSVITYLQALLDERRSNLAGVGPMAFAEVTLLKNNLANAYRSHIADEIRNKIEREKGEHDPKENMDRLMAAVDEFNFELMQKRMEAKTGLPRRLREFLNNYRKQYFRSRAMAFFGAKGLSGLKLGGKGVLKGTKGLLKLGKTGVTTGLKKTWESMRAHPAAYTIGGAALATGMWLSFWPGASVGVVGSLIARKYFSNRPSAPKIPKISKVMGAPKAPKKNAESDTDLAA